jgi:hypothetical protein
LFPLITIGSAYEALLAVARQMGKRALKLELIYKLSETPLHQTILPDQIATAEFLIKNGANLNLKDYQGLTPLEMAKAYGWSNMITLLSNAVAGEAITNANLMRPSVH